MTNLTNILRFAALAAVLAAGSCAAPTGDRGLSEDGAVNHPITVEPSYRALKIFYAPADDGIAPDDRARFESFVADYRAHGNGALAINAPSGIASQQALAFFAGRINAMGVPKDRILVATHDVMDGDMRVELDYIAYQAHADSCGDWSDNLAFTGDNQTPRNFGCAVQHNIAAQVADPRDLIAPRPADAASAGRRATVITNYEQGKTTSAQKTADQSAAVSDVQ